MTQEIQIGDSIPSFSVRDFEGVELRSDDLLGSPFVLYFYPKDDTPGCTLEACAFRDQMDIFDDLETTVLGVSPDCAASHQKFIAKHQLNFTLLCDEKMTLAKLFDVTQEKEKDGKKTLGIIRTTFLIDAAGIVQWIEKPVSVEGHSERVIQAIHSLAL